MRRFVTALGVLIVGLGGPPSVAVAMVKDVTLKEFVARSDLVVVAKVWKIEETADIKPQHPTFSPVIIATARVTETWKGATVRDVRFVASPIQNCDVADATLGQRLVLFLRKEDGLSALMMTHYGRGGMPLHESEGKTFATFWHEVRLPAAVNVIPGPDPELRSGTSSVEFSTLRGLVRKSRP